MMRLAQLLIILMLISLSKLVLAAESTHKIDWQPWSDEVFEQARRENKFVLLDLEAVWCHWCHVMEEKTYGDPAVIKLMQSHYIAVKVDQDANPDISLRYEDYGWPATVVFAADGSEIIKRSGYIQPQNMAAILDSIIKDPSPGLSVTSAPNKLPSRSASASQFTPAQREQILADLERGYDRTIGGWSNVHKFILAPNMEYALQRAKQGERKFADQARQTLDAALVLIDPVWGGFYQYSDRGRWNSPHFEKIMSIQADNLRLYTQAYLIFNQPRYLKAAQDIERYLTGFLSSPEGTFYTSQNADVNMHIDGHAFYPLADQQRRALGMPRIDTNIYARENGWAIRALSSLYDATGDKDILRRAIRASDWVEQHRSLPAGGFKHGERDRAGPYLGDTLAMAEAYLALYVSTADRRWLAKAQAATGFIKQNFMGRIGYATAKVSAQGRGVFTSPVVQMEENVGVARLANALLHYSGDNAYKAIAEHAISYLVTLPDLETQRYLLGPLLAVDEFASEPAHITVLGTKADVQAQALYAAATRYPATYRRIEWWDQAEGPLPNPDVKYPQLERPAAFICVNQACSTPIFEPSKISQRADSLFSRVE